MTEIEMTEEDPGPELPLGKPGTLRTSVEIVADVKPTNGNALVVAESEGPNPMRLIELALERGVDVDKLGRLMDLQERWEVSQARRAWTTAMAAFKADPPTIRKDRHVKFGNTEYDHATLAEVCSSIVAGLSKHGLSHRWETEQTSGHVTVTCIIEHIDGHAERTKLSAPSDTSGQKNAIQAIASSVTYLQRYTLLAATGLAAGGTDDDGAKAGPRGNAPTQAQRPQRPQRRSDVRTEPAPAEPQPSAPATPPEPCFVIGVAEKSGTSKNGKPWHLWLIQTDKHEEFVTFSESVAKLAYEARETDQAVLIASEPRPKGAPAITSMVVAETGETA